MAPAGAAWPDTLDTARGARADPSYWTKKRDKTPEPEIARACGLGADDANAYASDRLGLLEDPRYHGVMRAYFDRIASEVQA